jgi:hypothetical protein
MCRTGWTVLDVVEETFGRQVSRPTSFAVPPWENARITSTAWLKHEFHLEGLASAVDVDDRPA